MTMEMKMSSRKARGVRTTLPLIVRPAHQTTAHRGKAKVKIGPGYSARAFNTSEQLLFR